MDGRLQLHALGFWEVVDKPSEAELADYYATRYFQSEHGNYRATYPPEELAVVGLRIAQRMARAAELRGTDAPGRLLDVGCGEGFVLAAFAEQGWEVEGLDHSRAGVAAMNPDQTERVAQGNLFALLSDRIASCETHDLVWLGNVLEHVLDPVGLMRSLRRVVAPGGLLVVTVPNDGTPYHEGLLADGVIPERFWIAIPEHLAYFTAASMTRLGEATGWVCCDMHGDFPVDLFLAHEGSNYVRDSKLGKSAHLARLRVEKLIGESGSVASNHFYSALARVGLGRNITSFFAPQSGA